MPVNSLKKDYSDSVIGLGGQGTLHETIAAGAGRVFADNELPRALRCDAAGVLEFKDAEGVVGTYNVLQGEIFEFIVTEVTANTDVITHVWW
jgi:hypothetical protein